MSDVGSGNGFARDVRARIIERGFTKIPSHKLPWRTTSHRVLARAAMRLMQHGWNPTWLLAYDEAWAVASELSAFVFEDGGQPSEPRRAAVARRRARRGSDRVLAAQGQAARGRAAHVPGGRHGDVRHGVGATHGRGPGKLVPVLRAGAERPRVRRRRRRRRDVGG